MTTITEKLLNELNSKSGLKYPDVGYIYYADVRGDGCNKKSIYEIINAAGGVIYSPLNNGNRRKQCDNIRKALQS